MNRQVMPELSSNKLSGAVPFMYLGVDMVGPFSVKDLVQGRRRIKVWGVILFA